MSAREEWQEHYLEGLDLYIEQYDSESDDREPEEVCMEQVEFAEEYADDMMDDEDDEDDWDDDDEDDEDDDEEEELGPGGQGLAWQSNEEWFATLGAFNS